MTIVAPKQRKFDETSIAEVVNVLESYNLKPTPPNWLSEEEACDIYFSIQPPKKTINEISSILNKKKFDFYTQKNKFRRKKILIADMDSTIISSETIDELASLVGREPEIKSITKRAMKGELDFQETIHGRVSLLAGLKVSFFKKVLANIKFNHGAETLVHTMAANGALTVLVSGGFEFFSEAIAKQVGFDQHFANRLEIKDSRLTGNILNPILGPDAKRDILMSLSSKFKIEFQESLAIGDGANDIPMIKAAGLGIAYRGKPVTRNAALDRSKTVFSGTCIDHADLTAALFFQGYNKYEFIR